MPESTKVLLQLLERHYIKPGPMPGGVFVPECGVNGGFGAGSRADALYVGFTSSSGRLLIGHELKVSRADWRKELDTAGKADFWADNCHAWYVVAPGPEIVPKDEVPHGWGLLYPSSRSKTRMQVVVKAEVHADRTPDWTATRSLMARLDTLQRQQANETRQEALADARATADAELARRAESLTEMTPEQRGRLTTLDRLEELIGQPVTYWHDEQGIDVDVLAAAIRLTETAKALNVTRGDRYSAARLRDAANGLLAGLDQYAEASRALAEILKEPA